ncbi:MAG TPA: hypothetical protein VE998_05270, partial [Terriglobales bacterium]|nr:hypothetical protein [Terriglobales bacterium]
PDAPPGCQVMRRELFLLFFTLDRRNFSASMPISGYRSLLDQTLNWRQPQLDDDGLRSVLTGKSRRKSGSCGDFHRKMIRGALDFSVLNGISKW